MKAILFSSSISANFRSNLGNSREANSQVLGQAMNKRSIHTSRGETLHLLPAAGWGAIVDSSAPGERTLLCSIVEAIRGTGPQVGANRNSGGDGVESGKGE